MALTYAGLGIGIATLGANFQNLFQTTSLLLVAAFLFVLFGLNMLEIIQIRLPSMPLPSLQQLQNKLQGGNYIGALVMGILASLVVSPCTTAPLIGVLTYIAHTQNYYLGGIGLFILALGMGVPLMLIGIGFGRIVPKAGQWMYRVKQLFAACMFGMAIWLIGRKLPAPIEQWLFVILIVGYTILSGVLRVPRNKKHWLFNVLLYILLIYGIALAFATFNNNKTGYTPYEWFKGPSAEHKHDAIATIETPEKLTQTLKRAEKNNQNILLDYYAKWCSQCHLLNEKLKSPNIRKKLKKADIKLYRVDVSDYSQSSQTLLERMNVLGMPTLIFINNKTGQKARIVGQMSHEKILSLIQSNQ
jgi:thiol:disulfide interchange protein DsbD